MTAFTTDAKQKVLVYKIATKMAEEKLGEVFISKVVELAEHYEGAFELMTLWHQETVQKEKMELLADLQEEIDSREESHEKIFKSAKINYDELDKNIKDVTEFKKHLRILVDNYGGISKLAETTGIPQPSLSRFFNTASLPRNTTIYRIMDALQSKDGETSYSWHPPYTIEQIVATIKGQQ